jgi:meiotic recombination protein SPO11
LTHQGYLPHFINKPILEILISWKRNHHDSKHLPHPNNHSNPFQAKGYPDIQTRQFLHFLSTQAPYIPIYCLVDFDPDGLGIMSTYKHGSMSLAHQNANLAVSSIEWLGVRSCDILQKDVDKIGLLKLTKRDRRIAMRMLKKDVFGESQWEGEGEWRRELQVMLTLNLKAEIQVLSPDEGGLEGWLDGRLMGKMG